MEHERRKDRPILDDATIEQEKKTKAHNRREQLQDTIAFVTMIGLYIAPLLVLLYIALFGYHLYVTEQWAKFEQLGIQAVIAVIGFYIGRTTKMLDS